MQPAAECPPAAVYYEATPSSSGSLAPPLSSLFDRPAQYQSYSRDNLNLLRRTNFPELLTLICSGTLPASAATFAAEIAGDIEDSGVVVSVLKPLLKHDSSLVREGAVYGLAKHMGFPGVRDMLLAVCRSDESDGVRSAALDALA